MPFPDQGPNALLQRLDDIRREQQQIDIIIPCLDNELPLYIAIKDELEARGIKLVLPSRKSLDRRSKANLFRLCKSVGVHSPKTIVVETAADALDAAKAIGLARHGQRPGVRLRSGA
jgi:carbamoyl-phosphate synthase large subunit